MIRCGFCAGTSACCDEVVAFASCEVPLALDVVELPPPSAEAIATPTTTTTAPPRVTPGTPTGVVAAYDSNSRIITLTWLDDATTRTTLIDHVITVYQGDTPIAVIPRAPSGQKVYIRVSPPRTQSITISFTVIARNRYGASLPSQRSNTVTVAARRAANSESASPFYFDE